MSILESRNLSLLDLLESPDFGPVARPPMVSSPISVAGAGARKHAKCNARPSNKGSVKTEAVSAPVGSAPPVYISVNQVAARLSVSVATIWRWSTENPTFPKPIRFSKGTTRWLVTEIETFELSLRAR
jgi:predicted DNA-binding transcriptional regulator AlpA